MVNPQSLEIASRATEYYERSLRQQLEQTYLHQFVAVEPDSGDYFLGMTMTDAIHAARAAHPDRITFVLRIGHGSGIHLGVLQA